MTRPYFLDNSARRRCGSVLLEETRWRLPIMGSFGGPKGNFVGVFCMDFVMYVNKARKSSPIISGY